MQVSVFVQLKIPVFFAFNFCPIIWDKAHPISHIEQLYQSAACQSYMSGNHAKQL